MKLFGLNFQIFKLFRKFEVGRKIFKNYGFNNFFVNFFDSLK